MRISVLPNKFLILFIFISLISIYSCNILDSWMLSEIENEHEFEYNLSVYELFEGEPSKLKPNTGVVEFELTTPLFTDYASKQRLIRLPKDESLNVNRTGEFSYPDSTLIAKTFYYPNSTDESPNDYHIIETRLLYLINGKWNVAVYEWNRNQTEAFLLEEGTKREVKWLKSDGKTISTRYRIPSLAECTTCHQSSNTVVPIGPKLANMNHDILINNESINQLVYLESIGVLPAFNEEGIDYFPNWEDDDQLLEQRARAYMDVNCAHCHTSSGFADHSSLFLDYNLPLTKTGILSRKDRINRRLNSQWRGEKMPLIGTTVIHEEGVELIKEYLETL